MKWILFSAAAAMATAASAQSVSVASGDWSDIPRIGRHNGSLVVSPAVAGQIADALTGECRSPGASKTYVSVRIPFLVEFAPTGEVKQVVVHNVNCPRAEAALGGAVLQIAKSGEYRPTGENQVGWYLGEFEINQH
jgi:hypothetical protein